VGPECQCEDLPTRPPAHPEVLQVSPISNPSATSTSQFPHQLYCLVNQMETQEIKHVLNTVFSLAGASGPYNAIHCHWPIKLANSLSTASSWTQGGGKGMVLIQHGLTMLMGSCSTHPRRPSPSSSPTTTVCSASTPHVHGDGLHLNSPVVLDISPNTTTHPGGLPAYPNFGRGPLWGWVGCVWCGGGWVNSEGWHRWQYNLVTTPSGTELQLPIQLLDNVTYPCCSEVFKQMV
jgi:hypothetical protein